MSNYGQQPPYGQPYGSQNPYGQQPQPQPYGRQDQPAYGQPQAPYGSQPNPYAPGQQPPYAPAPGGQAPYGQQGYPGQEGQWVPPAPARPQLVERSLVVVTMDSVPGRVVTSVLGDVVGVVARSRELPRELRNGNPIEGYVSVLTQSRQDAVDRMVEMAAAAGADAVLGLRYDCSEITQSLSEVTAYGTAVTLNPVPGAADGQDDAGDQRTADSTVAATDVHPLDPPDFDPAGPQPDQPETQEGAGERSGGSVPYQSYQPPAHPWSSGQG
jgi:uncharacterized protein YbjQ (UPF0145 family)